MVLTMITDNTALKEQLPPELESVPTILKVTKVWGRELFPREREWLEAYMGCGNASEASRLIGITKSYAQYGHIMRMKLNDYIQANLKVMIGRTAPAALETIYDLACNCGDPKIQLAAAQDLLNRAGYKESKKIDVSVNDKSSSEIDKEIRMLLKKGGIVEAEVVK